MAYTTKHTASSIYYQARMKASIKDSRLTNRETTAVLLNVHPATLGKYEAGQIKVTADMVVAMADLYNAPELLNHYCVTECPIGQISQEKLEGKDMIQLTVQLHMDANRMMLAKERLMKIMEDNIIEPHEFDDLDYVMRTMTQIKRTVLEMELWVNKNIKKSALKQ